MKSLNLSRAASRRREYARRNFLRLERLEDRMVLSGASPVAVNDLYHAMVDQPLAVTAPTGVLANDTDTEGDALSANLFSGPAHGSLNLNSDGSFDYTPESGFSGIDSFIYSANDGQSNSLLAAVTLQVAGQGTPPQSVDDSYSVNEDSVLNIGSTEGVLGNDVDEDGDVLSAVLVTGPANGTLALNGDGSFTYIPTADFTGSDTFTYVANDGANNGNVATVNINVESVNDLPVAVNDSFSVDEDTSLDASAGSVLGNDTDVDGDALSAALVSGPQHGTLSLAGDGTFTYTPDANFNGLDGFSYTASDNQGVSGVATVSITVNPVNDAPTAADDAYSIDEDATLTIDAAAGVLANDTDVEGDALTAALVSGPANGTLTLNPDGSFSYTPTANFNGSDSFTYSVSDGTDSAEATVSITVNPVNDLPTAVNDEFTTDEDTPLVIAAPGVLGNDTDVDGDALSSLLANPPQHGSVTLNSDGSFTYTPNADFNGTDGFSYLAGDGTGDSEVATVTIHVNPVNDAPVGQADVYATDEDTPLTIDAAAGVLANDTDADGDPLTATLVSGPANGTLTLNADGSFSYTPGENFNGTDSFVYTAGDGTLASGETTVTINVNASNDAPVASGDEFAVDEDATLTIDAAAGVLANDTDVDGDALSAALVSGPANGSLTLNSDGSFSYTPNANFNGSDSFTYSASDGALSSEATVTITVNPVPDAPVAANDEFAGTEDETLTVDAAGGVLANDTDADGDPLTAALVSGPANGTLTLNADGSFSYTPGENFNGSDTFTYSASDGTLSSEATVTITIAAVNDAPAAAADTYATDENAPLSIDAAAGVLANDTDPDGDPLSAILVSGPANGSLTLNPDGSFSYTPNSGFSGEDSFVYQASDGTLTSEATATITVNPVQNPLIVTNDAYSTGEDVVLNADASLGVLANDFDPDGGTLTASLITGPTNGTLTLNADGSFSYAPAANWHGTDSFVYQTQSSGGATVEATATIIVESLNDAPVAVNDEFDAPDGSVSDSVMLNDSDVDGDSISAHLLFGPQHGELTLNPEGTFSYTAEEGFTGDDKFWYQLNDGMANSNVAMVTLHVGSGGQSNQLPASGDDAYTIQAGQTLDVATPGVLANDSDPEGDPLTAELVGDPSHGTLVLNPDGSFSYTPADGFSGSDEFTYQDNDGQGTGNVATVTLTITPEGTTIPIEAGDDAFEVAAETTLNVDLPGVLANDVDAEGDALTAAMVAGPAHGAATLNADGSFSYTPEAGFSGSDSFTYQASDGANVSNVATVAIEVGPLTNHAPIANNDVVTATADTPLNVPADQGVLVNDSDPDGDAIAAALFSAPMHGTVTLAEDGSFTYTPTAGYVGLDSFLYWVSDSELHSALAAVTIHVVAGDPDQVPPPGGCDNMSMLAMGEGEDDGLLDKLADPSLNHHHAVDGLLANGDWMA